MFTKSNLHCNTYTSNKVRIITVFAFYLKLKGGYIGSLRYTLFYSVHFTVRMKSITIDLNLTVQNGKIHFKGQWGMGVCSKLDTLIRHSALIMFSQSMNNTEEHKQKTNFVKQEK